MPLMHKYPTSFQAVDNVIIHREEGKILLGKKPKEQLWRFPGGFVDPTDDSLELAAQREMKEECGVNLQCSDVEYIGSFRVDDPRYTEGPDKIMSAVFKSFYLWGFAKAGDDLAEVKWVARSFLRSGFKTMLMPCHHTLAEILIMKGLV